jgi:hypothetical protein
MQGSESCRWIFNCFLSTTQFVFFRERCLNTFSSCHYKFCAAGCWHVK